MKNDNNKNSTNDNLACHAYQRQCSSITMPNYTVLLEFDSSLSNQSQYYKTVLSP